MGDLDVGRVVVIGDRVRLFVAGPSAGPAGELPVDLFRPEVRVGRSGSHVSARPYVRTLDLERQVSSRYHVRGSPHAQCRCHARMSVEEVAGSLAAQILSGLHLSAHVTGGQAGTDGRRYLGRSGRELAQGAVADWLRPYVAEALSGRACAESARKHAEVQESLIRERDIPALARVLAGRYEKWREAGGTLDEFEEAFSLMRAQLITGS